jgi:hypothetical protein
VEEFQVLKANYCST